MYNKQLIKSNQAQPEKVIDFSELGFIAPSKRFGAYSISKSGDRVWEYWEISLENFHLAARGYDYISLFDASAETKVFFKDLVSKSLISNKASSVYSNRVSFEILR